MKFRAEALRTLGPTVSALRPCPRSIQVGEFEVAISGGIWVAIRASGVLLMIPHP